VEFRGGVEVGNPIDREPKCLINECLRYRGMLNVHSMTYCSTFDDAIQPPPAYTVTRKYPGVYLSSIHRADLRHFDNLIPPGPVMPPILRLCQLLLRIV
jgi:hypothetical protein